LKGIEDRRQPKVEHIVEGEHMNTHGNNDIKYGIPASMHKRSSRLALDVVSYRFSGSKEMTSC
jgi:hypothetical protein